MISADVSDGIPVAQDAFPFFVGVARSGTTLVRAMVDAHPEITIHPESWFITELASRRRRYETPDGFDVDLWPSSGIRMRSIPSD